jgi:hypothetical protein
MLPFWLSSLVPSTTLPTLSSLEKGYHRFLKTTNTIAIKTSESKKYNNDT